MVKTAIQLYTLDGFDVSDATKVEIAAETTVDGIEIVFDGIPSDETVKTIRETALEVAGLSIGIDDLDGSIDKIVTTCEILDCDTVVLGYLDESYYESAQTTGETADLLSTYGTRFEKHGLQFLYHVHRHEFDSLGDRTHFDLLREEVNESVMFELDLGWIGVAGTDPYAVIEEVGTQAASVHLKDMNFETEQFVNLGDGDLDIERAARTAIEAGVDWLIYEHENPKDPVESVVTGASKLHKFKQTNLSQ
ncbi:sugar phosphate isomerase/epimerase family protein [Halomontanus rarus]|uniref:sugar phosphate isomerase/epimerase family protein n=1 Tax=Halomontanus rarus TaxID=3034020 RepID=UPI0023E8F58D|nr:sugar phosphate isomerase/epimerase [Halovivax sp. TS33]